MKNLIKSKLQLCSSLEELEDVKSIVSIFGKRDLYEMYIDREYELLKEFVVDGSLGNLEEFCKRISSIRVIRYRWVDSDFIVYPIATTVKITFSRCFGVEIAQLHSNVQYLTLEDTVFDFADLHVFPYLKVFCIANSFMNTQTENATGKCIVLGYDDFTVEYVSTQHCKITTYRRKL